MNSEILQFDLPEDAFQSMSEYLHEIMLCKGYVKQQIPYQIIFPESTMSFPKNKIVVIKPQISCEQLNSSQNVHTGRFFKLARDLLSYFVVLHRSYLDVPDFSISELYLDSNGTLIFDLVPENLNEQIGKSSVSKPREECCSLITDIFFHTSKPLNMSCIVESLNALSRLCFQGTFAEELEEWFIDAVSAAEMLTIINYLETMYNEQKLDYFSISFVRSVFNPFEVLFHELENEVAGFISNGEFENIIEHILLNTLIPDAVEHEVQIAIESSFKVFLGYELKGQSSKLVLAIDDILYETPIEAKVMRIRESKYQQTWVMRLIEKYFTTTFQDLFVVIRLESTDEIVGFICEMVKVQSEETVFTKTTNLHNILETHFLELDSRDSHTAKAIAAIENPTAEQVQQYQSLLSKFEADYIKVMHNSALYLGQLFPQLLEIFNLQPDSDLDEFDCMEGGRFLLTLVDHLIRPDLKILYIFNESGFVTSAQTDLNDNILMSILLNYNSTHSHNSTMLHFQEIDEFIQEEEKYRFDVLRKILKQAKIMSFEHILGNKVLADDFENIVIKTAGRKQNAYDVLTASSFLLEEQCNQDNYLCKYSELYKYIQHSGIYYADVEQQIQKISRRLFKHPDVETYAARAVRLTSKVLGISLDYFSIARPCAKQRDVYFEHILEKYSLKSQLDVLFIFAIATQSLELDQIAHIFDQVPAELQPACENLTAMRFLTKTGPNSYCIADLELAVKLVKQYDGNNYEFQLNRLFWLNVTEYEIECKDYIAQMRLFSELLRQYYCILQTEQLNFIVRRNSVVSHESSFQELDDVSFSLISKLDDMLSLSEHNSLSDSSLEDSDEFYAQYGIFEKHKTENHEAVHSGFNKEYQEKQRQITTELVKIKACLLLVGCLNIKSKKEINDGLFVQTFSPDNSYQIGCILSTTAHYIREVKELCGDQQEHSQYMEVAKSLETSCIIYYFLNIPTAHSMKLVEELAHRPLANCSKAMIAWKILRCATAYEASNYALSQLAGYVNFEELELLVSFFREFHNSETKLDSIIYVINIGIAYQTFATHAAPSSRHSYLLLAEVALIANRVLCNESIILGLCLKMLQIAIEERIKCTLLDVCYLIIMSWAYTQCTGRMPLLAESLYLRYISARLTVNSNITLRTPAFMQDNNVIKLICMNGHRDLEGITEKMLGSCSVALYFDSIFHGITPSYHIEDELRIALRASDFDFAKHVVLKLIGQQFFKSIDTDQIAQLEDVHTCAELLIRLADSGSEANLCSFVANIVVAFIKGIETASRPSEIVLGRQRKSFTTAFRHLLHKQRLKGRILSCSLILEYFYRPYCVFRNDFYTYMCATEGFSSESAGGPVLKLEPLLRDFAAGVDIWRESMRITSLQSSSQQDGKLTPFSSQEAPEVQARIARQRDVVTKEFNQFIYYWAL